MDEKEIAKEVRGAIKKDDLIKVKELIEADLQRLNIMTPFGTWLHVAASFGRLDIVKFLVSSGIDVNRCGGTFDASAINRAASEGHIDIVDYLLIQGAELDVSEPEKNPLFGAIYGGHLSIVKLLIEHGIDTQVKYTGKSMKGMDALAFARERGQTEIAGFLQNLKT